MLSPFFAWFFSSAKMSSCLRMRLAPSTSFLTAISRSSPTWRFFKSDKCMVFLDPGWGGTAEEGGDASTASGTPAFCCGSCGAGLGSPWRVGEKCGDLDVAVNKCGELGFGQGADLGRFDGAVLEKHERGDAADAVLRRRGLVFVDVELGHLEAAGVFLRHLIENRGDHLARAAPFGPIVHQHRSGGLQYLGVETLVGHVMDVFAH